MSPRAKQTNSPAATHPTAHHPPAPVESPPADLAPRRSLSLAEQRELLLLPVHEPEALQSYVKPHEGFERVAPLAFKRLGSYPDIVSALRLDLTALEADLARAATLGEQEDIAYRLHRRAMENRLGLESTVYRALLKLNRFLQASDDAELQRDFAELSAWVAARMEGSRRREPTNGEATPAPTPPAQPQAE